MSHFTVLVILSGTDMTVGDAQSEVARLLAPYDENMRVEPYRDEEGEESTYNPESKWDWYQIGGRWTGLLTGYDPAQDPRNTEVCFICKGTGSRDDALGQAARRRDPNYSCNGCQGKGVERTWLNADKHDANIVPVSIALKACENDVLTGTHAIVHPDGKWNQRGRMGWFAVVAEEKPADQWKVFYREQLQRYAHGHTAVLLDCHI